MVGDELVSLARPALYADDRGVLHGDGVFETMLAQNGKLLAFSRHQVRLRDALARLHMADVSLDAAQILRLLDANHLSQGEAVIRCTVTAGRGSAPRRGPANTPTLFISARALGPQPRRQGLHGITVPGLGRSLPDLKTLSYLPSILARLQLPAQPCPSEALFLSADQTVLEGATSNLFIVDGSSLVTPPADGRILPGVARSVVLDIAAQLEIDVCQRSIMPAEISAAFITNATLPMAPLLSLDGRPLIQPDLLPTLLAQYHRVAQ